MPKNYYDVLDEEERCLGMALKSIQAEEKKHNGLAMAAFQNEEMKKQWTLSVIDLMTNMRELQKVFDAANTALIHIIHSGADKNVEKDFHSVMVNVRNSMYLIEAKNVLKRITEKNKSVMSCKKCNAPMTVKWFKQFPETFETNWECECGHTFTETKNK